METQKIAALCRLRGLDELTAPPSPVSGGFLHRMFRAETAAGVYAVKLLNPDIMVRPEALGNMQRGEETALALRAAVPLCAALEGRVTEVDGSWFIVYPWVEGAPVYAPDITAEHCRIMGDLLGRIHASGVQVPGMEPNGDVRQPFDWPALSDGCLPRWDAQAREGLCRLLGTQVISHRDLDPKNVLWQGMKPCIIDWEAAGYVNPWQELIELVNYWAEDEPCARAMINAYVAHMDISCADWDAALAAGMDGMLGWLHYNLRRAAGLEGTAPGDRQEGEGHVRRTLAELKDYQLRAEQLRRWLKE